MMDNAQSVFTNWFELTDNVTNWEIQISKLKEDVTEMFDGNLDFDPVRKFKLEEEVYNKI